MKRDAEIGRLKVSKDLIVERDLKSGCIDTETVYTREDAGDLWGGKGGNAPSLGDIS